MTTERVDDESFVRLMAAFMGRMSRYGAAVAEVDALRAHGMKIVVRYLLGSIELIEEDADERGDE